MKKTLPIRTYGYRMSPREHALARDIENGVFAKTDLALLESVDNGVFRHMERRGFIEFLGMKPRLTTEGRQSKEMYDSMPTPRRKNRADVTDYLAALIHLNGRKKK